MRFAQFCPLCLVLFPLLAEEVDLIFASHTGFALGDHSRWRQPRTAVLTTLRLFIAEDDRR